jgi:hypothetical protein
MTSRARLCLSPSPCTSSGIADVDADADAVAARDELSLAFAAAMPSNLHRLLSLVLFSTRSARAGSTMRPYAP